jgi:hypothetical protein
MEEAIAAYNHASEEMRFHLNHQWLITNYAVIAYAALAATPLSVRCCSWRTVASVLAFVLVLAVAFQAWRTLEYSNEIRVVEHARLEAARKHLPLIDKIYDEVRIQKEQRSPGVWMPQWLLADLFGEDDLPRFPWGYLRWCSWARCSRG